MQTLFPNSVQAVSQSASIATPSKSLRLVALGDSLIYGYGDPEGGGWVERLRRRWMYPDSAGHVLYNLGVRGDRVKQVSQRLEDEFRNRGEFRHQVPDAMILSVGVNDSARLGHLQGRNFTDFEEFQADIDQLLDQAQRLCQVIFVGMPPIDEAKMPFWSSLYYNHPDQFRYKEVTRMACLERDIPYLDVFDLWLQRGETWWRSRLSSDGLHPNTAGYESLLHDFLTWNVVSSWLEGHQR